MKCDELKVVKQSDVLWGHWFTEYYLKSEADKVIEEKDETIDELKDRNDELQKATDSAWSKVNAMYDELRRHKYKRCLAMAEMSESMCYWFAARFDHHELVDNVKWELFDRWRLRWAKLADKFKEAK